MNSLTKNIYHQALTNKSPLQYKLNLQLTPQHRPLKPRLPIVNLLLQHPRVNVSWAKLLHPLNSQQPHRRLSLRLQNLKHPLHTRLPTRSKSKQRRPPQPNALRSQRQRFHDVRPALDAAVDPDFELGEHLRAVLADLEQGVQSWGCGVEGTAAVVGEDYTFDLRVKGGEVRVFVGLQAFEDEREAGVGGEPRESVAPGEVWGCAGEEGFADAAFGGFGARGGGVWRWGGC